jgi:hypothetical protein
MLSLFPEREVRSLVPKVRFLGMESTQPEMHYTVWGGDAQGGGRQHALVWGERKRMDTCRVNQGSTGEQLTGP